MKRPLSVTITSWDPETQQEIQNKFDVQTGFPRLRLIALFLRIFFSIKLD